MTLYHFLALFLVQFWMPFRLPLAMLWQLAGIVRKHGLCGGYASTLMFVDLVRAIGPGCEGG